MASGTGKGSGTIVRLGAERSKKVPQTVEARSEEGMKVKISLLKGMDECGEGDGVHKSLNGMGDKW